MKLYHAVKGYEIIEQIGEGGFGVVYRAYETALGRDVALKVSRPQYASQPALVDCFKTEARIFASLQHPHIVPLYRYWHDPTGRVYLVMRYLQGGSLRDRIKTTGPLSISEVVQIVEQITAALNFAHRQGVIHRDLKPSNILLDEDSNAYLTDFGLALALTRNGSQHNHYRQAGSLAYLSPEQINSELVAPQADIYSLGLTVYEMLTGQHPFPIESSSELLVKHLYERLPPLVRPDLHEAANQVLQRATAKLARERYPNMLVFAAALRQALRLNS